MPKLQAGHLLAIDTLVTLDQRAKRTALFTATSDGSALDTLRGRTLYGVTTDARLFVGPPLTDHTGRCLPHSGDRGTGERVDIMPTGTPLDAGLGALATHDGRVYAASALGVHDIASDGSGYVPVPADGGAADGVSHRRHRMPGREMYQSPIGRSSSFPA